MALNSSGPISLGGATTGESINLELGQSSISVVSLNDTNVRGLAGVSSGAITMPTDFWGKSSISYWFGNLNYTTNGAFFYTSLVQDSSGNIIITAPATGTDGYIAKINSDWTSILAKTQITPTGSPKSLYIGNVLYDGSNFYLTGSSRWKFTSPRRSGGWLAKLDTNLNLVSQNFWYNSSTASALTFRNSVYSSGYVYFGYGDFTSNRMAVKIDASSLAATSAFQASTSGLYFTSVCIDSSSGDIYFGGYKDTNLELLIAKFNSSFTPQYIKYSSTTNMFGSDTCFVYNGGYIFYPTNAIFLGATKIDASTGNFISCLSISSYATYTNDSGIAKDSSGNMYLLLKRTSTVGPHYLIKFDINLNVLWQRSITLSTSTVDFGQLLISSDGALLISFMTATPTVSAYVMKYPLSGSITGSYTVASVTATIAAGSLSFTSPTANIDLTSTSSSVSPTQQSVPGHSFTTPSGTVSKTSMP